MPINDNLKMAGPAEYAARRQAGDTFAPPPAGKRSSTPQPQHARSQQRANEAIERQPRSRSRDATSAKVISAQQAASLRMPVRNTLGTGPKPLRTQVGLQNDSTAASIAQHKNSFGGSHIQAQRGPAISTFDDTQSLHFDESTSIADDQDFHTGSGVFRAPPRHEPPTKQTQYHHNKSLSNNILHNWKEEADRERQRHGESPKFTQSLQHNTAESVYNDEQSDDGYEPDAEYYPEEEGPEANDTPSRPRIVAEGHPEAAAPIHFVKQEAQHVVPEEPQHKHSLGETHNAINVRHFPQQPKSRFQTGRQVRDDSSERPAQPVQAPISAAPRAHLQTTQQPPFSSKVSSYHESSSEEEQVLQADQPQPPTSPTRPSKRPREDQDLDFDMQELKTKSISDLDKIPFTVDPRLPPPKPAVDATGTPMTLAAKLTNLTKMRSEDDQRQLFQSLTDAEREQTADWFLEKFQADVQRLMDVRLERRKIALRYELEVKKRERSVQTKMEDVADELAVLRKGGGALIAGKGKRTED
ncbi:extracellular mutant protein 11-domain-containing protein [Exophiala viscosa]|uniref:Extracellular mutant protein 11-domain-containing protein n=1 Tax=Exophiala viscosa TaxID=2486360 RepID=A0AAN6IKZ1_9EURO|nr:extracellular mutant protein 11-domain-containing protein [Exophiala viscosa]KAI1628174.1 extracellular mutant protein 11-domain-containing protein [Exophiala viscosa]